MEWWVSVLEAFPLLIAAVIAVLVVKKIVVIVRNTEELLRFLRKIFREKHGEEDEDVGKERENET